MKIFVFILCFGMFSLSHGAERVALVIGNGAYQHTISLPNPANDATAVAEALEQLDFKVVVGIDLDQRGMRNTIREFGQQMSGAEIGLLFYAGHGLQVSGRNYLVPIDAQLKDEIDLPYETVDLGQVLTIIERTADTTLVFLDACRDNPLSRTLARSMGASRSSAIGRGLAQVRTGTGTLIAFATEPGNVASDGAGDHSPFTTALLDHIASPGLDIAVMLRRVRQGVISETNGQQVPWSNSSLTGDFYFAPPIVTQATESATANSRPAVTPAIPSVDRTVVELAYWDAVKDSGDRDMYESYLSEYPDGIFSKIAAIKLLKLEPVPVEAAKPPTSVAGIETIAKHYLNLARGRLAAGDFETAIQYTNTGLELLPGDPKLLAVMDQITKTQASVQSISAQLQQLMSDAQTHIDAKRYTTPKGMNAFESYQRILELDPGNAGAEAGLARIVDKYIVLSDLALKNEEPDKAARFLGRAKAILSEYAPLLAAEERVEETKQRLLSETSNKVTTVAGLQIETDPPALENKPFEQADVEHEPQPRPKLPVEKPAQVVVADPQIDATVVTAPRTEAEPRSSTTESVEANAVEIAVPAKQIFQPFLTAYALITRGEGNMAPLDAYKQLLASMKELLLEKNIPVAAFPVGAPRPGNEKNRSDFVEYVRNIGTNPMLYIGVKLYWPPINEDLIAVDCYGRDGKMYWRERVANHATTSQAESMQVLLDRMRTKVEKRLGQACLGGEEVEIRAAEQAYALDLGLYVASNYKRVPSGRVKNYIKTATAILSRYLKDQGVTVSDTPRGAPAPSQENHLDEWIKFLLGSGSKHGLLYMDVSPGWSADGYTPDKMKLDCYSPNGELRWSEFAENVVAPSHQASLTKVVEQLIAQLDQRQGQPCLALGPVPSK